MSLFCLCVPSDIRQHVAEEPEVVAAIPTMEQFFPVFDFPSTQSEILSFSSDLVAREFGRRSSQAVACLDWRAQSFASAVFHDSARAFLCYDPLKQLLCHEDSLSDDSGKYLRAKTNKEPAPILSKDLYELHSISNSLYWSGLYR